MYKIADKGFENIDRLRRELAEKVEEHYKNKSPEFFRKNSFLAAIYGNRIYCRKVGDDCITEILSKYLPKRIQKIMHAGISRAVKRKQ